MCSRVGLSITVDDEDVLEAYEGLMGLRMLACNVTGFPITKARELSVVVESVDHDSAWPFRDDYSRPALLLPADRQQELGDAAFISVTGPTFVVATPVTGGFFVFFKFIFSESVLYQCRNQVPSRLSRHPSVQFRWPE